MAENRRFYYLKLKENFYNSETMVVLESMPDGLLYSNLLLKMYLMSLRIFRLPLQILEFLFGFDDLPLEGVIL